VSSNFPYLLSSKYKTHKLQWFSLLSYPYYQFHTWQTNIKSERLRVPNLLSRKNSNTWNIHILGYKNTLLTWTYFTRPRTFRYSVEHSPWGQAVIRQGTYGFVCHNSTRKLGWNVTCIPILQILEDIWFLDSKEHSKPRTQCVIWSSDSSRGGDMSSEPTPTFQRSVTASKLKVKQPYQSRTQNPKVSKVDASRPSVSEQWQFMIPHSLLHKIKWYLQTPQKRNTCCARIITEQKANAYAAEVCMCTKAAKRSW